MEHPAALPSLFIILYPICIVDVSGIDNESDLVNTLLATLFEHDYGRQEHRLIITRLIQNDDFTLTKYSEPGLSFDIPPIHHWLRLDLLEYCRTSSSTGILKFRVRWESIEFDFSPRFLFAPRETPREIPQGKVVEKLVVSIVSRSNQKHLCLVHLKGATTIRSILQRIVGELQFNQYYILPGNSTDLASAHAHLPAEVEEDFDFFNHFRQDIDSNNHLVLSANAYKERTAIKTVNKSLLYIDEIPNITGQKSLPRMIVTIYARRLREWACQVDLTGINDAQNLRQCITRALMEHDYIVRAQLVLTEADSSVTTSHEPLTDEQLFCLCYDRGDSTGRLGIFADVCTLVVPEKLRSDTHSVTSPKSRVKIVDWETEEVYGYVEYNERTDYDCYEHFTKKDTQVAEYTRRPVRMILGPRPDWSFDLNSKILSNVLREKGDKTGTLAISVILVSSLEDGQVWPPRRRFRQK